MQRYHVRRTDREVTEPGDLSRILAAGRFATIALCHDGEPYVVTLSYGYDEARNALYFHAARAGRKLDAITTDPRACATVIIDRGYRHGECKHDYESVVIGGTMSIVETTDEKRDGMRILIGHLEQEPAPLWERYHLAGEEELARLNMLRLDIETMTGKAGS